MLANRAGEVQPRSRALLSRAAGFASLAHRTGKGGGKMKRSAVLVFCALIVLWASVSSAQEANVDAARKEGKVIWYTSLAIPSSTALAHFFMARYKGIEVEVHRTGSQRVLQRVMQEASAGIKNVDVLHTSDAGHFVLLKDKGLLIKYVPKSAEIVPAGFKDRDGFYYGFPGQRQGRAAPERGSALYGIHPDQGKPADARRQGGALHRQSRGDLSEGQADAEGLKASARRPRRAGKTQHRDQEKVHRVFRRVKLFRAPGLGFPFDSTSETEPVGERADVDS